MTDTPSRLFGLLLVLVGVWVVTYWMYEPARPRITTDLRRDPLAAVSPSTGLPAPSARPSVPAPPPPAQPRTDLLPLPSAQTNTAEPHTPRTHRVQKVIPPEFREYVIQRGDVSWEAIAGRKEVYGDRSKWQSVSRANPWASPDRLKIGQTRLKIAVDPENIQGKLAWVEEPVDGVGPTMVVAPPVEPAKAATKTEEEVTYTIAEDDTLWTISRKMYGQGAQWKRIYEANRNVIKDPDRPPKGAKIRIPPPESAHAGE